MPTIKPISQTLIQSLDKILWIAKEELFVHEIAGPKDNPRIVEYQACTSLKAMDDETPWCSSFVNWVIKQAGLKGTNSAAARSWLKWGKDIALPVPGCIVVLRRGEPPSGHVAFYIREFGDFIICLGGNQDNQVKYSTFRKINVLGYRIP